MRFNRLAVDALVSSELSFGYYQMNNHTELNRTPVVTKLRQTSRNRTCIFGAATVSCNCVPAYPRRLRRYRRVEKGVCYADCVGAKAGEGSFTSFAVYSDTWRNPYAGRSRPWSAARDLNPPTQLGRLVCCQLHQRRVFLPFREE